MSLVQKIVKRVFDILFALIGIFFTWWIILIAIVMSSIETKSFGVFVQKRVGKEGKLFSVFKIKTMKSVEGIDTTITTANDMRITKNGKFFRDTKIDELPQLLNVLFGSMSFVGPRPDVEGYADILEGEDRLILTVRPGITGPATLKYKNEEDILAGVENPKEYNNKVIWVDKVKINKEYVKNWSLKGDVEYIFKTLGQKDIWIEFFFQSTSKKRVLSFFVFDILLSLLTIALSYLLRFNFAIEPNYYASMLTMMLVLTPIKIISFLIFRVYHVAWRFFGLIEYERIVLSHFVTYVLFAFIYLVLRNDTIPFPLSVIIIDMFLSIIFIGFFRISKRLYLEHNIADHKVKLLIIGTNSKSLDIIKSVSRGEIDYSPKALVSDDKHTIGTYFHNVPVYSRESIEKIIEDFKINSVVITEQLSQKKLMDFFTLFDHYGIKEIKIAQMFQENKPYFSDLSIEDLLARHPKDLDKKAIASFLKAKRVLITGAGGSIGSEIAKQCEKFEVDSLLLVDNGEYNLYQIGEQISHAELKLLDITNKKLLEQLFEYYKPEIVIHAAAYKHVPLCEGNHEMAIRNNICGSMNVIDLSIKFGVQKVVIVSTDKAVRPTNVMGATKRVVELYANNIDTEDTDIVAVRFGNVLGSSGSVIPKFKQQIEKGGPVTVTHPDINRYFMLIPEACQLVLQTAAIAKGRELFVLDMGEPIKIIDLAKQMIRLYGKEDEIEIKITGLRPGEKLYEELLIDESERKTKYSSIFIAKPTLYNIEKLNKDILNLLTSNNKIEALKKIVPEFAHESLKK